MPETDKNLRETVKDVLKETTPAATSEELSKGKSGETNAGDTPEYVSGIDISDIPVGDRPRIKALLESKAKLLEKGYQPKFEEVSKFKKAMEELSSLGIDVEEAKQVLTRHSEQKKNPTSQDKKDARRVLDTLIDEAPAAQKEELRQLRKIVLEETNSDELKKKVTDLESMVSRLSRGFSDNRRTKLSEEIDSLKSKYGGELIDKYSDKIMDEGLKYENLNARKILFYIAPEDEIEQAVVSKKSKTKEKVESISSPGSGVVSSSEQIDTKGSWKDFLTRLNKT